MEVFQFFLKGEKSSGNCYVLYMKAFPENVNLCLDYISVAEISKCIGLDVLRWERALGVGSSRRHGG